MRSVAKILNDMCRDIVVVLVCGAVSGVAVICLAWAVYRLSQP